jgi:3-hydroxyisobutyrate dehydrogenase-like beta-hydroxyacid dehydrogenase
MTTIDVAGSVVAGSVVGFSGLGDMGAPMAMNLVKRGATLIAHARRPDAYAALVAAGATGTTRAADLARADVVFLCLPNGDVVESVLFGDDGIAAALRPGTIVVDTSTIGYATTLKIGAALAARDVAFVDAPISGMHQRAVEGTLTIMCGGDDAIVASLAALFAAIGDKVLHFGAVGTGQLAKLINQLLFDVNVAALAELLPMAAKMGLDPVKVGELVNSGTGRSYASEYFIPKILDGVFSTGYPLEAAYKDLVSGAALGAERRIPMPVLAAATATYQTALLQGHGHDDKGAMIKVYEDLLGVAFRKAKT